MARFNKPKLMVVTLVVIILFFGISIVKTKNPVPKKIVTTGLTKGQSDYLLKQLEETGKQYSYIQDGQQSLMSGDIENAIRLFEIALKSAYSQATEGEAIINLANAYEKKKDYEKALEYIIIDRDNYVNEWAKEPILQRTKYLEYASRGEYELAIEHAKKAIVAEMNIHNSKTPRSDYTERLNDLIAAKDYILSLKKSNQ